ncbi:MAG: hypothetical protein ACM3PT_11180 [Deltaproteobacteria bacterium]
MLNLIYIIIWLQIYSADLDASRYIFQQNTDTLHMIQSRFIADHAFVLSIAAPEISRYVVFKDYIETKSLELLYVKKGYKYCNFSIGYFQMRPRFVEELENYIRNNELNEPTLNIVKINNWLPENIRRKIRINRLKSFYWQIMYAYAFYYVAEHRFKDVKFRSKEEKIIFFANAYNYGFLKPIDQIWDKTMDCNFPYGKKYKGKQDNYGELSLYFYNKYASELNKISSPTKDIYKNLKYFKQIFFFSIIIIVLLSMFVWKKVFKCFLL